MVGAIEQERFDQGRITGHQSRAQAGETGSLRQRMESHAAAQSGIAGSTTLGDGVIMAGQSGATGHIELGAGAIVGAKSAVTKDVAPASHVAGVPAVDVAEWREATVLVRRLPDLRRAVAALDARLAAIEAQFSRDRTR